MYKEIESILNTIKQINIRKKVGIENGNKNESIKQNHYLVTIVEEFKKCASELGFDFRVKNGFIYFFTGQFWKLFSEEDLKSTLGDAAARMGIDEYLSKYYLFKETLAKQFFSISHIKYLDEVDTIKINLLNGTYEFAPEKRLREFRKEDFLTYQLPFQFAPDAEAPLFNKYLNRVLPDKNCQDILAEYLGYVFTNNHKQQKVLLLYGNGANGKSVFFEITRALLGNENVTNYSLKNLNDENCRALISNKLLNYSGEIDASINHDIFKQLCSGEPLQARLKYRDSFTIDKYAKMCFNCNELPKDVEHTNAYFRRFLIVPFKEVIPENEQNKDLAKEIISTELSGIFNWVLEGLNRLEHTGSFTESQLVNLEIKKFRDEADTVQQFLFENYEQSKDSFCRFKDLYSEFTNFCNCNGYRPLNIKNFKNRLEVQNIQSKRISQGMVVYLKSKSKEYLKPEQSIAFRHYNAGEQLPF